MKKIIVVFIFLNINLSIFAQDTTRFDTRPLNSINIFGDASLISTNYERLFPISSNILLSGKLGLGYNENWQLCFFGNCSPAKEFTTIPHSISCNIGKGRHFCEFGLGGTIVRGNTSQHYLLYPTIGYRILPKNKGRVNFRIFGQIPFSGLEPEEIIFIPFGISLGLSF